MRVLALCLLPLLKSCAAWRPPLLSDEIGCSPTLSFLVDRERYVSAGPFVYFDPLNLCKDETFARFREAELKHGRVAMLAVAQIILIPILKRATTNVVPRDFPESILYGATKYLHLPDDLTKVLFVCGFLEAFVFVQQDASDMPGDYGVGFFGVRNKALHETQLSVELENGRLAMLGFLGFLMSDYITGGESWLEQWLTFFEKWVQQS